jgi:hypothetical protein
MQSAQDRSAKNTVTASWIMASIVSPLSTGFSAHSHQRSNASLSITYLSSASAYPNACLSVSYRHPLDVAIQGAHNADPRKHRWPTVLCNEKKRFHRGLPFNRRRLLAQKWKLLMVISPPQ